MTALLVKDGAGNDQTLQINTDPSLGAKQDTGNAALSAILAKIIAAPATEATLNAIGTLLAGTLAVTGPLTNAQAVSLGLATQTTAAAILAKLSADPATQTTLAALLAKVSADPATQTTLAQILTKFPTALAAHGGMVIEGVASGVPVQVAGTVSITDISSGEYEDIPASAAAQVLGGAGAAGDWIEGILVIPGTTSPGNVLLTDGALAAVPLFVGGTNSVSNVIPFLIPLGMKSVNGPWKVTLGVNVTARAVGNFT